MSENLILRESEQKETDCIPLMKAGSQRNLDHKINSTQSCNLFQNKRTANTCIPYVYVPRTMYVCAFQTKDNVRHGKIPFHTQLLQTVTVVTGNLIFKDVRANCFCASLLRTQIRMPRHA